MEDFLVVGVTLALLIGLVVLRGKSGGKYEVHPTDAVIAVLFAVLWLLVSGQISTLDIGSEGVKVETVKQAILKASAKDISDEVFPFPLSPVGTVGMDADATIDHIVATRTPGLQFILGLNSYHAVAIKKELTVLTQFVFFQYVILTHADGSLFGMLNAHKLVRILSRQPGPYTFEDFARMVNSSSEIDQQKLKGIPSFIDGEYAVDLSANKRDVLERMDETHLDWLPVLTTNGRFFGVIRRSQLTTSLLLDVTQQLSERKEEK